jgi:DNA repair protein RadA/Sms
MATKDNKTMYVCSKCGYKTGRWAGKCSNCGEWNTLEEFVETKTPVASFATTNLTSGRKLKTVSTSKDDRILTGISEFDRVVGGGLVTDSFNLLSAPPGCGKSTLAIMVADRMISLGYNVLYASGEESASQIKNRAARLGLKHTDEMYISDSSNLDFAIDEIKKYDIDFIVLDSIQTFYLNEFLPSKQGNPTQTNGVVSALKDICKQSDKKRCVLAISQMNKKEEIAGYNSIPHIVDACLYLEGDDSDPLRILHATKNRFGDVEEAGFFYMRADGLQEVNDISNYFITKRNYDVVGVAITGVREANRYAMCEVEALTPKSFTSFPSRIGTNVKKDDLNILVSILEQRANMVMADKSVIIKTSGNINLRNTSSNIAILMAIVSSYYNKSISGDVLFYGDVSLTGELKKCPNLESFANEADRLGYRKLYVARGAKPQKNYKNLEILEFDTISQLIKHLFGGGTNS